MARAAFLVTVDYTPLSAETNIEVEQVLRDAITAGINEGPHLGTSGPADFILDQYEVAPVVGTPAS